LKLPIKIAHLSSAHPDGDVRIFHKQCVSLAKSGFDVSLIIPNTTARTESGVKIISFELKTKTRFGRIIRTVNKVYEEALKLNAHVYQIHDPELLRIAVKLKRKGKIVIYDAHEDLPRQVLAKSYIPKLFRRLVSRLVERYENSKASKLTGVIAATPFIRDRFLKINTNTVDINNYPILEELLMEVDYSQKPKNEICYVGNITVVRGVLQIVQSLPETKAKLILAGKFDSDQLKQRMQNEVGWKQVEFLGFVNRDQVRDVYKHARIGLVTLHPIVNYLDSLPVKMFEYLAAGIPVIASDFPLWKKIIDDAQCGICADPLNPKEIASALNELLNDETRANLLGQNGKAAVRQKFNWTAESEKLVGFYKRLTKEL
jgi:glycosyltransferase involved in cell wall biosynthesis